MKLGYFSHTKLNVSETFIYDLVKSLNEDKEISLTYYSGVSIGNIKTDFDLKYVLTGFDSPDTSFQKIVYTLKRFFNGTSAWEYKMQSKINNATRALEKNVTQTIDCALVDYANSAILLRDFFEKNKIPFILHVHGYDITSSVNIPAYKQQLQLVLNAAKFIIAASNYMKRLLVLLGADESKIKVVRYGIDVDEIKPLSWNVRKQKKPSIIFLGRLTPKKHPIALLHAFKLVLNKIPDATLTIIGDGPLKKEVEDRIKKLQIANSVKLLGSMPREKSFPVMNEHWLYAQHSVTAGDGDQEGYALSPAEAAAHELPVVSTLHNGIPEHVIDGVTGFLVPEFNYEAMAEKIIFLLNNPDLSEQFGKKGRENIKGLNIGSLRTETIKHMLYECVK